jgi:hypothetical protein
MIRLAMALAAAVLGLVFATPSEATMRSHAVKAEFRRMNPCPSTGRTRGACPGYQVDHREALICGGLDEVDNLQWLSVEDHKAKTRVEVKLCRTRN